MKPESLAYLKQFDEAFQIAHRSGYVCNIPIRKLKRLISIYNEIIDGDSGFNAHDMCREGKCLLDLMLKLRVEYLAELDKDIVEQDAITDGTKKGRTPTATKKRGQPKKRSEGRASDEVPDAGSDAASH